MCVISIADLGLLLTFMALLFLPGLLLGGTAGLRGWQLAASAPVLTYGVAGVAGPVTARVGLDWNVGFFALSTLVLVGATLGVRALVTAIRSPDRRTRHRASVAARAAPEAGDNSVRWTPRDHAGAVAGVLIGACIGAAAVFAGVGSLQSIHQAWDATFHANAVRYIADSGAGAPSALRAVNEYAASDFFYPNAYHLLCAVVLQVTEATVPAVLNAQMILLPGLFCLALTGLLRWAGVRPAVAFAAGALGASFAAFPYDTLWRGPLLPYGTGLALFPSVLLLLGVVLRARTAGTVVLAALASVGTVAIHPSVAIVVAFFALSLVVQRWISDWRRIVPELGLLIATAGAIILAGMPHFLGTLGAAASAAGFNWKAELSTGDAIIQLFSLSHASSRSQWWLVLLLAAGLVTCFRLRRLTWLLLGGGVFVTMFFLAASSDTKVAQLLTQPWWNDRWRFVAIVAIVMVPVAASGLVALADGATRLLPAFARAHPSAVRIAPLMSLLVIFGLLSRGFYIPANADRMERVQHNGPAIFQAERRAMNHLGKLAGDAAWVMNDPRDGSPWMLAIAGVRPVFGHIVAPRHNDSLPAQRQLLLKHFNELDTNRAVQRVVRQRNVRYVFVGEGFVKPRFHRARGLTHLNTVESLDLVYANKKAKIYRVTLNG